jgi:type 1 glutamine amidotransferase
MDLNRTARFVLVFLLATSAGLRGQSQRPKVLFVANPMGSDNEVIRRSSPEVLSVAERYFDEISRGIFEVTITQNGAEVTAENLIRYKAVVFFTAINPPGVDKDGLLNWVRNGGAFAGIHSTANTYQTFPPFGLMLGANFDRRPWRTKENPQTKVRIKVNDRSHPSTRHFQESFEIADDIYQFKNFDAENTQLLLSLDSTSLEDNPRMNRQDKHLPVSWARSYGTGRVFYTALGDWEATWKNQDYQTHLLKGIQWAMRDVK